MNQHIHPDDFDFVQNARQAVRERRVQTSTVTLLALTTLIACSLIWANFAELEEITRGEGKVIPSQRTQVIQSLEGGIIEALKVREGDRVKKGQSLVQIDDTGFSSNLGELRAKYISLVAKVARLKFEVAGNKGENLEFDPEMVATAPNVFASERKLFDLRQTRYYTQQSIFESRLTQKKQELLELEATRKQLSDSISIAQKEFDLKAPLAQRGVVSKTDLLKLERELADLGGKLATNKQALPRAEASIREAQKSLEEHDLDFRQTAQSELAPVLAELAIVEQSLKGAKDKVVRTEMRSPVEGVVNKIHITTIGGVVRAGEPIIEITPVDDSLLVEVRIDPKDVAFVGPGQPATVKLTAYDFTVYGSLNGEVKIISSDSILDKQTNNSYYLVTIRTNRNDLRAESKELPIIPGMVATADIITGKKSVLQYLLKPIIKARHEALRER